MDTATRCWLAVLRRSHPHAFTHRRVLECGSQNITGSVRDYFEDVEEYIGVDCMEGKDVDVVSLVHEYKDKYNSYFDTVISCSMLEHDPYWRKSIERMVELLGPGGTLILSYGGSYSKPHESNASPIEGYYLGLEMFPVLDRIFGTANFREVQVEKRPDVHDHVFMFLDHKII